MTIWDTAGAAIDSVFADPAAIIYTGAGLAAAPVSAIRSDQPAPDFAGPGQTARTIGYEVAITALPNKPSKSDYFTHRSRKWRVIDITTRDEIGKYVLIVQDDGAAA